MKSVFLKRSVQTVLSLGMALQGPLMLTPMTALAQQAGTPGLFIQVYGPGYIGESAAARQFRLNRLNEGRFKTEGVYTAKPSDAVDMIEYTNPYSGETSLIGIQKATAEEIRNFSPQRFAEQYENLLRETEITKARIGDALAPNIYKALSIVRSVKSKEALELKRQIQKLQRSARGGFEAAALKSQIAAIKYRLSTINSLPVTSKAQLMKVLTTAELSLDKETRSLRERLKAVNGPKGLVAQTAMRFPMESLLFNTAMGMVMAIQLQARYAENPLAIEQTLESLKTPEGHLGFFSFMLANGAVTPHLHRALGQSWGKVFIPYLGMTAGMMASNLTHDTYSLIFHSGLPKCVKGLLGDLSKEETQKLCEHVYEQLAVDRKIVQYGSGLVSLIGATAIAGMGTAGVTKAAGHTGTLLSKSGQKIASNRMIMLTGAKLLARTNNFGLALSAGHLLGKTIHFTGFLGADTLIHPKIAKVTGNLVHGFNLGRDEDKITKSLIKELPELKASGQKEHLLSELQGFNHHFESWTKMLLEKAETTHLSWMDKVNNVIGLYSSSQGFYSFLSDSLKSYQDSRKENQDASFSVHPLDLSAPLNGVRPYQLQGESYANFHLIAPNEVLARRLITLQSTLHYMDGVIRASENPSWASSYKAHLGNLLQLAPKSWNSLDSAEESETQMSLENFISLKSQLAQDKKLAHLFSDLKALGSSDTKVAPQRMGYAFKSYVEGLIDGINDPIYDSMKLSQYKKLRTNLSLNADPQKGDLMAETVILNNLLVITPEEMLTTTELSVAKNKVASQYLGALLIAPETLLSSYIDTITPIARHYNGQSSQQSFLPSDITNTHYVAKVYERLGAPLPLMEPGRGLIEAYYDSYTSELQIPIPFKKQFVGEKLTDFMLHSMICGPNLNQGEKAFKTNRSGFRDEFHPPAVVSSDIQSATRSYCQRGTDTRLQRVYQAPIQANGKTYQGALELLKDNFNRTELVSDFDDWWLAEVGIDLEELSKSYGEDYRRVAANYIADFLTEGKDTSNLGNISNGLIEAMRQKRNLYIHLLGELARVSNEAENSVGAWIPQNTPLFTALKGPQRYAFAFQKDLEDRFVAFESLFTDVEVEFDHRNYGLGLGSIADSLKLKKIKHFDLGFKRDDYEQKAKALEAELVKVTESFGLTTESFENSEGSSNVALTEYQQGLLSESLKALNEIQLQFVTLANLLTALDYEEAQ